jgi:hypothetical protein
MQLKLAVLGAIFLSAAITSAQTVDQIIAKNLQARGGLEKST